MTMPRLHPDDLEAIIEGVSKRVGPQVVENIDKFINATNQTYTVKQVAQLANSDHTTILRHINKKLLVASRVGKSWKITQDALDNYLNNKQS